MYGRKANKTTRNQASLVECICCYAVCRLISVGSVELLRSKSVLIMWGSRWILSTCLVSYSADVPGQLPMMSLDKKIPELKQWWRKLKQILLVNQRWASIVPRFDRVWILDDAGVPSWVAVAGVRAFHVERLHPGRPLWGLPLWLARKKMFQSILKWSPLIYYNDEETSDHDSKGLPLASRIINQMKLFYCTQT